METHTIVPLMLAKVASEMGAMTYLAYHGKSIMRPYVMWFIQTQDHCVLIDTAIEAEDYRTYHPGFSQLPFEPVNSFEAALASVGREPADIDIIIHTHLHMDHIYNTPKCPKAKILVQEQELRFALKPHPIFEVLFPRDIIRRLQFETLNGAHKILPGIEVMPAPGHTPGCQAVVVDTSEGKAVITGGCSIMENYTPPADVKETVSPFATYPVIAPGIHTDLFSAYASALKIREMADIIIPMHDPQMAMRQTIP
jgi:glyoxylase-like metal-dependent hydrolase (beta-lactamase superfamily II)